MIRDAVLHLLNEQPLLADLYRLPEPGDAGVLCTNLRHTNGRSPVFVDDGRATFWFPYQQLRFVEVPARSLAEAGVDPASASAAGVGRKAGGRAPAPRQAEPAPVGTAGGGANRPTPASTSPVDEEEVTAPPAVDGTVEAEVDLELDESFLRRIRDI